MSVETGTRYLTISLADLEAMGACDEWSGKWYEEFRRAEVAITPARVGMLLDEGFPLSWFMGEANYHTTVEADRVGSKAICLGLLDDCRPLVAAHLSEAEARRLDDARAQVAALDPLDHWNWWQKVNVDFTTFAAGCHLPKEWLLFVPLSAATRASDLCGLVDLTADLLTFSGEMIGATGDEGSAAVLPRTCAAIAQFGVDNFDAIRERIDDLAEQNRDDDDDDYEDRYDYYSDEDTEEEIEEDEDDGDGEDIDQPAPQA